LTTSPQASPRQDGQPDESARQPDIAPGDGSPRPSGRLELTWTNKSLRLLATEDGSYQWLAPGDFRIAEVRLLREVERVGQPGPDGPDNLLIRGDALNGLTSLLEIPELRRRYAGKVQLAYLDPPFNRQQAFEHYPDALEHSVWLTMMRDRLKQIRALLAPTGSVWVHCDDSEQAYLKVLMDEVFLRPNFVATIVWQKRTSRENRKAIGSGHDYIICYAPAGAAAWAQVRNRLPSHGGGYANPDNDARGPWRSIPMSAQAGHATKAQFYDITTPTGKVLGPPRGRCWTVTQPRFEEFLAEGRVYFPRGGDGRPRLKRFPWEDEGLVPMTWWPAAEVGDNDEAKKEILALFPNVEPFDTPKPERLMRRIVEIATNLGDIVLDCFAGSGTTAAVAHKLGRRWLTIEMLPDVLDTFALPRLRQVVKGEDPGGITEAAGWQGGGGFRALEVGPSMFERVDGVTLLAAWAVGGSLQEATAAQIGYAYEPDPPFCGRKGRTRLAVIDGLANRDVIALLAERLAERETLLVYATAVDSSAHGAVAELRGARLRRIPSALLAAYARARIPVSTQQEAQR